jgi:hypothetical protein
MAHVPGGGQQVNRIPTGKFITADMSRGEKIRNK